MLKSASKKMMKTIRSADVYGEPITLTYERHNKFKTHLGGFWTIILGVFMTAYFSFLFWGLFARNTINFTTNTVVKDLTVDTQYEDIGKSGFVIAIGLRNHGTSLLDDSYRQYIEVKVEEIEWILNANKTWTRNKKDLKIEKCGDNFAYDNKTIVQQFGFDKYVWVTSNDYQIGGNWYAPKSKYIEINLRPWSNSTYSTCQSSDDIDWFISNEIMDIVMLDKYFDLHNFDDPVGEFITEKFSYNALYYNTRTTDIFVSHNEIELMDSVFQYQSSEKEVFYSIAGEKTDTYDNFGTYLRARIMPDPKRITYNRTVYSLMDMVAQLGGVFNVLRSVSYLILGYYAERMMYYWVLRKSYQFNSKEENNMPVFTNDDKRRLEEKNDTLSGSQPRYLNGDTQQEMLNRHSNLK
jgi:hypothetical protein